MQSRKRALGSAGVGCSGSGSQPSLLYQKSQKLANSVKNVYNMPRITQFVASLDQRGVSSLAERTALP